ncbi:SPRY domain-containing SOCS box protein 3 isoform X4 [Balaenoptera musculus]|uniref:SPRY domain-containing SOCS box protein 3 n=1 Tax=Balaenoptera musculus TaxID=9771 RepID=A0A8B8VA51_BALMU|nr:SPRY domain-containing SOCS box protein 3 isoform X4 [Balaenoptera musculus]XP_036681640.1 SPRY domain-containing SOCS box protein 3 isoform X4 [Balaenoptera musculus]XP_036681641.1 SPRY domain-containing SOCS box protein 3 isoform X4 [Balaenoptera musculus]
MRMPGPWLWQGPPTGATTLMGSDSDSDPEYASLPSSIPSAVPVTGESFCDCDSQSEAFCGSLHAAHRGRDCRCGEEDEYFDWVWDDLNKSSATLLSCDNRKVNFHMEYSCGTAAIRGTKELGEGQHFWEIKMTSPVYGTDMMVGIGTSDVDLDKYHHTFCSLLGRDEDSWGLSYTGLLHHKGDKTSFSSRFGQGSIIGVHLDTWHGTLTFFKNRKCIGEGVTLTCARRVWLPLSSWSGSHQAAEQEVLPDGVLHGGQEQHEGDPLLCQHHLPAVPVLLPPAPAAARLWGHARGPAPATRPQAGAAPQAGLGPEHELRPPQAPRALAHSQSQQPRDPALPEEALPKDLACFPVKTAFYSWDGVFCFSLWTTLQGNRRGRTEPRFVSAAPLPPGWERPCYRGSGAVIPVIRRPGLPSLSASCAGCGSSHFPSQSLWGAAAPACLDSGCRPGRLVCCL